MTPRDARRPRNRSSAVRSLEWATLLCADAKEDGVLVQRGHEWPAGDEVYLGAEAPDGDLVEVEKKLAVVGRRIAERNKGRTDDRHGEINSW